MVWNFKTCSEADTIFCAFHAWGRELPRRPELACRGRGRRLAASPVVEEAPASPIVPAGSRLPAVVRGRPAGRRRRLGAAVGCRRRQRSAPGRGCRLLIAAAAASTPPPQARPLARSKSNRRGSSSIVHRPRRQQAAGTVCAAAGVGGSQLQAAPRRQQSAAGGGGGGSSGRWPPPRDRLLSTYVTGLAQPEPWP